MVLTPRGWFRVASDAALDVITGIPADAWDRPGLGEWSVRELAAHTLRAWKLLVDYLDQPTPEGEPLSAGRYFAEGLTQPGTHAGVLVRGQQDARSIDDIAEAARVAAQAAEERIRGESDERLLASRFGAMTLGEFLRTRAFELTVHGIDVARATGQPVPAGLIEASVPAIALLAEVAVRRDMAIPLLLAATGRAALPAGFNLLA